MNERITLKPCPFCGGRVNVVVSDDEGNDRCDNYERDPWSGLSYKLNHTYEENEDCPVATHSREEGGSLGVYLYDNREEAVRAWNTRND